MAFERFKRKGARPRTASLDQGLAQLHERVNNQIEHRRNRASRVDVRPTGSVPRNVYYAADMDSGAEAGEVVWVTVPSRPPKERSMLVVGRDHTDVLGLLISPEQEHAHDDRWFEIGPGDWEASGSPCWVRLDKTLIVPEADVHRRGTTVPQRRFERVANTLRERFAWS